MLYYRGTKSSSPMSDWGHAMFVDNYERSFSGLGYEWTFDGSLATPIEDLKDAIMAAWEQFIKDGYFTGFSPEENDYYLQLPAEDVFNSFNPEDIVNSAGGYDDTLVSWLCDAVIIPMDIKAVITQDGAVVFDESLIKPMTVD